ncbi:UbiA family prenyltransferase [Methanolobus sp. ZRKC4]|uniref:UbiA family prenyltransferase n=1 Tax=Methanolobus sp. ZRKC4 TaxID=3125787 RepID=UPI003243E66C
MSSNCTINHPGHSANKYDYNYSELGSSLAPTLNLLKSSVLVSFSGALRIHIAFLLMHISSVFYNCLAGGLIIYAVYTLDRAMDVEEDAANRPELKGASKKTALIVSLICFLIGAAILSANGLIMIAFLPLVTGYLYTKGLTVGKFKLRLKGSMGVKNTIVGLTWGAFIAGIAGASSGNVLPTLLVFLFFGTKLFVNSAIYDFKDVKGDFLAGIKTLPVTLGEKRAKILLFTLHLLAHSMLLMFIMTEMIAFEPIILGYSFIIGLLYIKNFAEQVEIETNKRLTKRLFMIDGESTSIVGLRTIVNGLIV